MKWKFIKSSFLLSSPFTLFYTYHIKYQCIQQLMSSRHSKICGTHLDKGRYFWIKKQNKPYRPRFFEEMSGNNVKRWKRGLGESMQRIIPKWFNTLRKSKASFASEVRGVGGVIIHHMSEQSWGDIFQSLFESVRLCKQLEVLSGSQRYHQHSALPFGY